MDFSDFSNACSIAQYWKASQPSADAITATAAAAELKKTGLGVADLGTIYGAVTVRVKRSTNHSSRHYIPRLLCASFFLGAFSSLSFPFSAFLLATTRKTAVVQRMACRQYCLHADIPLVAATLEYEAEPTSALTTFFSVFPFPTKNMPFFFSPVVMQKSVRTSVRLVSSAVCICRVGPAVQ